MPEASPSPPPPRYAIVGGGVSGLAAGFRLRQLAPRAEVQLFEASDRLGGPLRTLHVGDVVLEQGADSFLTRTPWAVELCRKLGLSDQLVPTNTEHRRALVVRDGKLFPVPEGFVLMRPGSARAILRSPLLSLRGKLRLLAEPFIRSPGETQAAAYDESVASFATRRLGREAFERIVQPLVAGIFVADAQQLSLRATFPEFLDAERTCGSLRRARRQAARAATLEGGSASSARYGAFVTLRRGMGQLIHALADNFGERCVSLSTPIANVAPSSRGQWKLTTSGGVEHGPFAGVVITAPAPHAGRLVAPFDALLTSLLERIEYASSSVVTMIYQREQIPRPLDGFGIVVPAVENRPVVAVSFPGVKFPHASPAGLTPIRVFLGGALRPEVVDRDDAELVDVSRRQLAELIGARGNPSDVHVARWRHAMPQYHVGHVDRVDEIERRVAAHRGLALAGNAYRGVGIPQCIHSGFQAAERLIGYLS